MLNLHMGCQGLCVMVCAASAAVASAQVKVTQAADSVSVEIAGRPYTTLFTGPKTTKPYLHPVRSASGKIVTRSWPMEQVAGEVHDHPHQRGLWFSHGNVNGITYWDNEPGQSPNGGRIVLDRIVGVKSGAKSGSIAAVFNWLDLAGKPLLSDERTYTFTPGPGLRIIDVDILLTALQKAVFGDTKEGTFALRLTTVLEEPAKKGEMPPHTGRMVNAEGAAGEDQVWGKRSSWVDYCGRIEGEPLGVAIFDHPSNPRHPTWWHARGYGLFAANIFGLRDFERDPSKDGSLTLAPKDKLHFRYRVVIHDGDTKTAGIAALYDKYAGKK